MDYSGIDVGFSVNGVVAEINASEFTLSVSDSIHKSFPTAKLELSDPTGMLMEMGTFFLGSPLEMDFTIDSDSLQPKFRVSKRETKRNVTSGLLSGKLAIEGISEPFFKMAPARASFKGLISDAVTKLFGSLFTEAVVETTVGESTFFQLEDPETFLRDVLLPIAISSQDEKTPYFAFGSLDGKFHFESLFKLAGKASIAKLVLKPITGQTTVIGSINGFLPFTEDIANIASTFQADTDSYIEGAVTNTIGKVTEGFKDSIPFVGENLQGVDVDWLGPSHNPDVKYEEFEKARRYDACRPAYFLERALVFTSESPLLISGETVDIEINLEDSEKTVTPSEYYTGTWLIERSLHSWDGSKGQTTIVVVRPSVKPISDSVLGDTAFK